MPIRFLRILSMPIQNKARKKLLVCPSCESSGKKYILGKIDGESILIERFNYGFTRVTGTFTLECGNCNEPVYIKQGETHLVW